MADGSTRGDALAVGIDPWSAELWAEIERAWTRHRYPPSATLIEQDQPVRRVSLIEEGIVKLSRWEEGGRRVVIGLRFPGWVLGAASAILEEASAATAETLTRCSLREVSAETFQRSLKTTPEVSWHVHQLHSRELYDQIAHLAGLGSLPARRRLERLLWELIRLQKSAHKQGGAIRLVSPLKGWELAEAIMITPQHLSRLFKKLEEEHVVRREKGWLIVLDANNLRQANASREPVRRSE